MPFLVIGVEHTTAPLDVRERLTFDSTDAALAGAALVTEHHIEEAIILSTCNRTEIYLLVDDIARASDIARATLTRSNLSVTRYVQTWTEIEAVERLFRVAAGLESQVPGEAQITSQVGEALHNAEAAGSVGPNLHAMFRAAVSAARQARASASPGRIDASVGSEAVALAEARLDGLTGRAVLVIGGGEVSKLVAHELRRRDIGSLYIANRTDAVAAALAEQTGGLQVALDDMLLPATTVDVIFTATGSPLPVLTVDMVRTALHGRTTPLHIFDLAVPRDVEPHVRDIPGVVLLDLDDLLPVSRGETWSQDAAAIEAVLGGEIQEYLVWYHTRRVAPVIASLRSHVEAVQRQEMKRIAPQIINLSERERAAVESMGQRLVDKMFHHLVLRLRLAAQTDPALVDAAEFFFLHGEGGLFDHAAQSHAAVEAQ